MSVELGPERGVPATGSRRQRQRQETFREIVTTARKLLSAPEGLSLRGVAAEMGMTPPALYRYVDSYHELQVLVARDIMADLSGLLDRVRRDAPADDPGLQLMMMGLAFRNWSLSHRSEFSMAFANAELALEMTSARMDTGDTITGVFFPVYVQLHQHYRFSTELPEGFDLGVAEPESNWPVDVDRGLACILLRQWVRFFGTVTLEVYRQVPASVIEAGALLFSAMYDNGVELNMGDDLPRLVGALTQKAQDPHFLAAYQQEQPTTL